MIGYFHGGKKYYRCDICAISLFIWEDYICDDCYEHIRMKRYYDDLTFDSVLS